MRKRRTPMVPFRILTLLHWGGISGISCAGNRRIVLESGPVTKRLAINYRELWSHISWLEENSYVKVISRTRGIAILELPLPPNLNKKQQDN